MWTLLLRLSAPMQSWGTSSRFDERDSQLEPSKSGVLGLICAALGRDRTADVADLASLRMGVRVDREGHLMRDYQTATGVLTAAGKPDPGRTVVSPRYFLADAAFLIGLEGDDGALLRSVHDALRTPVWPLYLGRKCFPPGDPVWVADGLQEQCLRESLSCWPRIAPAEPGAVKMLRMLIEAESSGALRLDQPAAPFSERQFGPRYVTTEVIDVPV